MSEQASGTHGPIRDDAIKRQELEEIHKLAQEWPEPVPTEEDEPEARWAPGARLEESPTGEDWEAVELRSDLATHLNRTSFPTDRARLLDTLTGQHAEQRLLDLVSSLPDGETYGTLRELVAALGLPFEERPA